MKELVYSHKPHPTGYLIPIPTAFSSFDIDQIRCLDFLSEGAGEHLDIFIDESQTALASPHHYNRHFRGSHPRRRCSPLAAALQQRYESQGAPVRSNLRWSQFFTRFASPDLVLFQFSATAIPWKNSALRTWKLHQRYNQHT